MQERFPYPFAMAEDIELKYPFDAGASKAPDWPVEQEPTDLLALWPHDESVPDEPPTQTEVIAALQEYLGDDFEVLEEAQPPSPDICWAFAARLGGVQVPVMFWAQQAMEVPPGELGDAEAEACRWAIGLETLLDTSDPLSSYSTLLRALSGAIPHSPAVIDINSTKVHSRNWLDEMFGGASSSADADSDSDSDLDATVIGPAADELWTIHAVQAEGEDGDDDAGVMWLHTHGLWRCGLPEVEMLEVPAKHVSTAAELLNDIAALMFEFPPPAPGERYEVGDNLAVTFQPWQEVVATMKPDAPGGAEDRKETGDNPHVGARAVVCGLEKRGSFREVWTWPQEVVERLEDDEATIYMTHRATQRQASMARSRWDDLATAFAAAQKAALVDGESPRAVFLVKAGFNVNGAAGGAHAATEHLWFEVHHFNGESADATLINQPVNVDSMNRGDRFDVKRTSVSDWQVQTAAGSFGPQDLTLLWRAIDALKSQETDSKQKAAESRGGYA